MQSALRVVYPSQCVACGEPVAEDFSLCAACWAQTPFILGEACDLCGAPVVGAPVGDETPICDACVTTPRPWSRGRAAMRYAENGRRMVLGLKHGDRTELARAAGVWLQRALEEIREPGLLIVPVPLHWTRIFSRGYNQAALLAGSLARVAGMESALGALVRTRRAPMPREMPHAARLAALRGAIVAHPRKGRVLAGRRVLLVDDVMTTGATLAAGTRACLEAGARDVFTLTLARAVKEA